MNQKKFSTNVICFQTPNSPALESKLFYDECKIIWKAFVVFLGLYGFDESYKIEALIFKTDLWSLYLQLSVVSFLKIMKQCITIEEPRGSTIPVQGNRNWFFGIFTLFGMYFFSSMGYHSKNHGQMALMWWKKFVIRRNVASFEEKLFVL